jgi:hypothetical protein
MISAKGDAGCPTHRALGDVWVLTTVIIGRIMMPDLISSG